MDNETSAEGFREVFLHDFISSRRASFTNARGKKFLRILLDDVRGRVILFLGGTDIGIDLLQGMSPTAAGRQAGRLKRLTTACMTYNRMYDKVLPSRVESKGRRLLRAS